MKRTAYLTDGKEVFETMTIRSQKELDSMNTAADVAHENNPRWTFEKPSGAALPREGIHEAIYRRLYGDDYRIT